MLRNVQVNHADASAISAKSPNSVSSLNSSTASFLARKQAWWDWHKANPQVWELFERFSFEAIQRGHKKISHWLIINRIRWETTIITQGGDFKISNDYIAFYARLFRAKHPQHKNLFNVKKMIGESSEPN